MEVTMAQAQTEMVVDRGLPNLFDSDVRKRLSAPGFRAFLGVTEKLGLSVQERRVVLGDIPDSTYHKWRSRGAPELTADMLTRISLMLGIFKGLRLLFASDEAALRWLKATNQDTPFAGRSPEEFLLQGPLDNLFAVRRYIDAWRGVRP
jgi:hypothetical protein